MSYTDLELFPRSLHVVTNMIFAQVGLLLRIHYKKLSYRWQTARRV